MPILEDASADNLLSPGSPFDSLQSSDGALRLLVEHVTDYAIYMLDPEGRVVTWNPGAERNKGYKREEVLGRNFSMFFLPEDVESGQPRAELQAAAREGRFETQTWRRRKGGERFWALVSLTAIRNAEGALLGFAKVTRDMTAQKRFEEAQTQLAIDLEQRVMERTAQLEASVEELRAKKEEVESLASMISHDLAEKEVLLREVYHRVKNNLQVVQSLLKMGSRTLQAPEAKYCIDTAIQRVHVMAMVHEHLYQMPDLSGITLSAYLRDLAEGAIAANAENQGHIQLKLDVEEIPVPWDFAIPFGLLANELVSNCLKHGLAHGRRGVISISAHMIPGAVRFVVHDNGVGLPEDFNAQKCTSMGIKLASSLAHQLGGRLEFASSGGCRIQTDLPRLSFQGEPPPQVARPAQLPSGGFMADRIRKKAEAKIQARVATDPSCFLS